MKNRPPTVKIKNREFLRILVKTSVIKPGDKISEIITQYAKPFLQKGDIIAVSESALAISQGRAIPVSKIRPRFLARFLWRFVRKVPYGIGLRSPYSMECAIRECGELRILFASIIGGITRFFGRRGDFYRIAGKQAAMIDAPYTSGVKEYYTSVIMGPKEPDMVAKKLSKKTGCKVAIVDVNDIGGSWVVGASDNLDKKLVEEVLRDNPAGQGDSLTPIVIIREISSQN